MAGLVFLMFIAMLGAPIEGAVDQVVSINSGQLRGVQQELDGINYVVFKGIPYAEPPTGPLRFMSPVKKAPWDGVFNATSYSPSCLQDLSGVATFYPKYIVQIPDEARVLSEDCLTLNVFTTASLGNASGSGLAVVFYIHGGSFLTGQGSGYDGSALATRGNVVVVTVNYRLSIFGFWGTGDENAKGNYGLLDQQLALSWVNENIAAFGGDPGRVTIFGQSAGGNAASLHLFANVSRPLFRRVAVHSGPIASTLGLQPRSQIAELHFMIGQAAGCYNSDTAKLLKCLRDKSAKEVFDAGAFVASQISPFPSVFIPFIDDVFLSSTFDRPNLAHDLLVLHTSGDGSVIIDSGAITGSFNASKGISEEQFRSILMLLKVDEFSALAIIKEYVNRNKIDKDFSRLESLVEIMLDWNYIAYLSTLLKWLPPLGTCHSAIFDHRSSADNKYPRLNLVPHGEELSYVFGLPFSMTSSFTDEERALSDRVISYWSNFAKSGDPNVNSDGSMADRNLTFWPRYGDSETYMLIQLKNDTVGEGYRRDKVKFWTEYLPQLTQTASESCPAKPDVTDAPDCENALIGEGLGLKLNKQQAESLIEVFLFVIIALLAIMFIIFGAVIGYKFKYKEKKTRSKVNGMVKTNGSIHKNSAFEVNEAFYSESEDTKM